MKANASLAAWLEVDVLTLAKLTVLIGLVSVLFAPLVRFFLLPYSKTLRNLSGPPVKHWLWGSWDKEAYAAGQLELYLLRSIKAYGPVFSLVGISRVPVLVVCDHRAVAKIMQIPYQRSERQNEILRRHFGRGLLTEGGATHRRQRKVAHPAFTANAVFDMAPIFRAKTALFVERLRKHIDQSSDPAQEGTRINIAHDLNRVALDIIGSAGFGYEFNSLTSDKETSELETAFQKSIRQISSNTLYGALRQVIGEPIIRLGRFLRVAEQVELDNARAVIEKLSGELVSRAKKSAEEGDSSGKDVLSLMVRANVSKEVKPSQRLTDLELMQMVPAFLTAGHDTTSNALSWACHSLIQGERGMQLQQRIRDELFSPEATGWMDDSRILDGLPFLESMVKETLRYHCPVRHLFRTAPFDDVVYLSKPVMLKDGTKTDKLTIKKGEMILYSISYLNRCEDLWGPDGLEFKPERWLPEGHQYYENGNRMADSVKELKGVYSHLMSFGAGPNQCIGAKMSIMEIKYTLAALMSNFELIQPNLAGEKPVKIVSVLQIVAHPLVEGEKEKGWAMPIRIRPLSGSTAL